MVFCGFPYFLIIFTQCAILNTRCLILFCLLLVLESNLEMRLCHLMEMEINGNQTESSHSPKTTSHCHLKWCTSSSSQKRKRDQFLLLYKVSPLNRVKSYPNRTYIKDIGFYFHKLKTFVSFKSNASGVRTNIYHLEVVSFLADECQGGRGGDVPWSWTYRFLNHVHRRRPSFWSTTHCRWNIKINFCFFSSK